MPSIQVVDSNFAYEFSGRKTAPANQPKPETKAPVHEETLHPWLKNTFLGAAIGGVAGSGTALAVSHFLEDPLPGINKAKLGGIQGLFAGASGAVAASFAPDRASGTVIGGITGAASGVVQSLAFAPSKGKIILNAITGFVAGAAAGNVTVAVRDRYQLKKMDENGSEEKTLEKELFH